MHCVLNLIRDGPRRKGLGIERASIHLKGGTLARRAPSGSWVNRCFMVVVLLITILRWGHKSTNITGAPLPIISFW